MGQGRAQGEKEYSCDTAILGHFWEYRFNEDAAAMIGVWIRGDD